MFKLSLKNSEAHLRLIEACRMLVSLKLDSGPFGNVSIRIPHTNQFLINPKGVTFDHLSIDDLTCMNIDGEILGEHEPHPGEFIHREIYALRSDVHAIVHTHSMNTVCMSLLGETIEPYTQLGASIFDDQALYHGFNGPVRTTLEGKAIALALQDKAIVIAKNHGLFAVGESIERALWDMVISDMAAEIHLSAKKLGLTKAERLSPELMMKSKVEVREKQYQFMWASYLKTISHTVI